MGKVTVHVNKDHIENSDRFTPESCMVANAFRVQHDLTEDIEVGVDGETIEVYRLDDYEGTSMTAELPKRIQEKIEAWDDGKDPQPFFFEVEFPDDWRERLNRKPVQSK